MAGRYLARNAETEIPSNLIFFDSESTSTVSQHDPRKRILTLRLWCAISVRLENGVGTRHRVQHGFDAESFWDFVDSCLQPKKRTWLFAHNANFDLTQLHFWEYLDDGRYTCEPLYGKIDPKTGTPKTTWQGKICAEPRPFFVVCRKDRSTLTIVDTCNYWPKPLAELGDDFEIPKLPMPAPDASERDWLVYCERDVEVICRAVVDMLQVWNKEGCGVFKETAAMLAMQNFRHTCDILTDDGKAIDIVCKPDAREHILERQAYHGGRVCCYYVGERNETIYHVDCNSLYPFVMSNHSYPRAFLGYKVGVPIDELARESRVFGIVAETLIETRHKEFPVRVNGLQCHCNGRFWTVLCGAELQRAINDGSVLRTGVVQYYSLAPLFAKWVGYWYARKLRFSGTMENRRGDYEFSKLILNSLSGKFAQHGRRWVDRPAKIPPVRWGPWVEREGIEGNFQKWRAIAGNAQVLSDEGEPAHAFPAISAFITSNAREYMGEVIEKCGYRNVYYLSTDALIVNDEAISNLSSRGLLHPTQLGAFKMLSCHRSCRIGGANFYQLDGEVTASGLAGVIAKAKKKGVPPEVFESIRSILHSRPDGSIGVETIEPQGFVPDYRGNIGKDGFWFPWRVTMDSDFTDRPPRSCWEFADSPGMERDRILSPANV